MINFALTNFFQIVNIICIVFIKFFFAFTFRRTDLKLYKLRNNSKACNLKCENARCIYILKSHICLSK